MLDSIQNRVHGVIRTRIITLSKRALQIVILAAVGSSIVSVAQGQISPPIGPETYRTDTHQIGVGILTGMVKTTVQQIVTDTNAELSRQGKSIRIQMLPFKFWSPSRMATQYTNRPNEWFVKIPTMIGINVDIPVVADRQIYYPLDLNLTCNGWQTNNGVIKVTAQPGPPSVEGGSIIEDVIHVRDYIDGQVRSHLPGIAAVTQTIPNSQCVTIGASTNTGTSDPFAFIAWDAPIRRPIGGTVAIPRLEVSFIKLKRLRARGNGALLYSPTENIMLDVYANFNERQSGDLTMKEDDELDEGLSNSFELKLLRKDQVSGQPRRVYGYARISCSERKESVLVVLAGKAHYYTIDISGANESDTRVQRFLNSVKFK